MPSLVLVGLSELGKQLSLRRQLGLLARIRHRLEDIALTPDDTAIVEPMRREQCSQCSLDPAYV